jgi:division protein CdvB (Snf7/Vps24/ESCRT-III family)
VARPENTGLEKDFYTQDDVPEGEDPQVVENLFAEFEAKAATVIRELSQNRAMPNEREQFDTIMNFIALAATRVPTMRDLISRPMEDIVRKMATIMVSVEGRLRTIVPRRREGGCRSPQSERDA